MSNPHETSWTEKYYMGEVDGERIYLSAPSWDCEWYWGFGYLGNKNCHYHLDGMGKKSQKNMYDALIEHFKEHFIFTANIVENDYNNSLWEFCELVETAYTLKEYAEVCGRGGSHYSTNPCAEVIKNPEEATRINSVVLPAIFNKIDQILKEVTAQDKRAPSNKSMTSAAI